MWGNVRKTLVVLAVAWAGGVGLFASFYNLGLEDIGVVPLIPIAAISPIATLADAADILAQFYVIAAELVRAEPRSFQYTTLVAFCILNSFLVWRFFRVLFFKRGDAERTAIFGPIENSVLAILLICGLVIFAYPVFEARAKRLAPERLPPAGREISLDEVSKNQAAQDAIADKAATGSSASFRDFFADADPVVRGAQKIVSCKSCHSLDKEGPKLVGATLWNVVGRDIASVEGVYYSRALRRLEGVWSREALDAFLENPSQYAPGTAMVIGVRDGQDRADIITFLEGNTD